MSQPDEALQAAADAIRNVEGVSRVGLDRVTGQIIFVFNGETWFLKLWCKTDRVENVFPVLSTIATEGMIELCIEENCPNAGRHYKHTDMTEHDRIRMDRALRCDRNDLNSVRDAVRGLQATDHPSLVPLYDALMERFEELKSEHFKKANSIK